VSRSVAHRKSPSITRVVPRRAARPSKLGALAVHEWKASTGSAANRYGIQWHGLHHFVSRNAALGSPRVRSMAVFPGRIQGVTTSERGFTLPERHARHFAPDGGGFDLHSFVAG
jgi:hypothetical protein